MAKYNCKIGYQVFLCVSSAFISNCGSSNKCSWIEISNDDMKKFFNDNLVFVKSEDSASFLEKFKVVLMRKLNDIQFNNVTKIILKSLVRAKNVVVRFFTVIDGKIYYSNKCDAKKLDKGKFAVKFESRNEKPFINISYIDGTK